MVYLQFILALKNQKTELAELRGRIRIEKSPKILKPAEVRGKLELLNHQK
jgi:hypothetical protein